LTVASKGPERTLAPFSTVPVISTILEPMVSPSWGELTLKEGGVVSAGSLCVVTGDVVAVSSSAVEGSSDSTP
jgi:hypothetical protein